MSADTSIPQERIRLVFELERADNPRLYDDLIQCKKGSKRVNRLRTLAQEGLLAQHWSLRGIGYVAGVESQAIPVEVGGASVINQVFDEPLAE
jgi:hypothetical protein